MSSINKTKKHWAHRPRPHLRVYLFLATVPSTHHHLPAPDNNVQRVLSTVVASGLDVFLPGVRSIFTSVFLPGPPATSSQDGACGDRMSQILSDPPNKSVLWAKSQTPWGPTPASAVAGAHQPRGWLLPRGVFPATPDTRRDPPTTLLRGEISRPRETAKKSPPAQEKHLRDWAGRGSPCPWAVSS